MTSVDPADDALGAALSLGPALWLGAALALGATDGELGAMLPVLAPQAAATSMADRDNAPRRAEVGRIMAGIVPRVWWRSGRAVDVAFLIAW